MSETSNGRFTQSLFPSAGVFVTFRQTFKPWLGYSANFGYTRATYRYIADVPSTSFPPSGEEYVPNNLYETSVSYIAQKRFTNRLDMFGEAGAGALGFASVHGDLRGTRNLEVVNRSNNFRPTAIGGFGFDYRLSRSFGLRATYRGLFVKYPDYHSGTVRPTTLVNEPSLSATYRFGKR